MKFDMNTATSEEHDAMFSAKIFDAITGEQLFDLVAFDTETGWRRHFLLWAEEPRSVHGNVARFVELVGNPLRIEYPNAAMPVRI